MSTLLYIANVSALDDINLYNKFYNELTNIRKEKVDKLKQRKDQMLSVASEIVLRHALKEYTKEDVKIEYIFKENEKPYLKDKNIYFNISHSNDYTIVALSDSEIGVDIEEIKEIDLNISKRFFTNKEYYSIIKSEDPINMFYRYWTLKESFIKNTGLGLKLSLNSFLINIEDDKVEINQTYDNNIYYLKEVDLIKNYHIAICAKSKLDDLIIKEVDLKNL